jgi:hypothetical protein
MSELHCKSGSKDGTLGLFERPYYLAAFIFGARITYQLLLYEIMASPEAFFWSGFLMEGM